MSVIDALVGHCRRRRRMTPRFITLKHEQMSSRHIGLALAAAVALIAAADSAGAASRRGEQSVDSRPPGEPLMAIVSLRSQRVTIYDAGGWMLRAPVSTGQRGRETPAGIFSVIQKEAEHYSNLYDDAFMPHMQ